MRSRRLRVHIAASRMHRWLAAIIGVQLLLWFASGLLMSVLPIAEVRGEHLVDRDMVRPVPVDQSYANPGQIVRAAGATVEAMTWRVLGDRVVVEVKTARGVQLFDAVTAVALPPIGRADAVAIARNAWRGQPAPAAVADLVSVETTEYRAALPAWRVTFADRDGTRVFVATRTGRITAVRTDTWRLYDFFWGLHIMDWKNHEDFNTPWIIAFASGGLVLAIVGTILLYMRWPRRRRPRVRTC